MVRRRSGWLLGVLLAAGCGAGETSAGRSEEPAGAAGAVEIARSGPLEKPKPRGSGGTSSLMSIGEQTLVAPDAMVQSEFGDSVAVDGDTLLVGAAYDNPGGQGNGTGSAYFFERMNGTWVFKEKVVEPGGVASNHFGVSVALSGDTAVVGAEGADDAMKGVNCGAAYVYVRVNGAWTLEQKVIADDGLDFDNLGASVALSGDTLVAGAPFDDDKGQESGSAYVFVRSNGVWTQQQKLLAPTGMPDDRFGAAVTVDGDVALVGAYFDDEAAKDSGSVHAFARTGAVWALEKKITPADGIMSSYYGLSLSLAGDRVLVGAPNDAQMGSVYVLLRAAGAWQQQQKILAQDAALYDNFGISVALQGNTAVIGAYATDDQGVNSGAAYLFGRAGAVWSQAQKLVAPDGMDSDHLGYSVAFRGDTLVAGARWDDSPLMNAGSARVYLIKRDNGEPCTLAVECSSALCVDGVCCDNACGGGALDDCQACHLAGSIGVCAPIQAGIECRGAAGACDVKETCDGMSVTCPADALAPDGTVCPGGTCNAGQCEAGQDGAGGGSSSASSGSGGGGTGGNGGSGGASSSSSASSSSGSGSGSGGSGGKAGSGGAGDGGMGGSGGDEREEPRDNGGCACREARAQAEGGEARALLILGLFFVAARRRGRASCT